MREIVFDTETTGLSPAGGDRVVEIGCVEIINRFPTGKTYHCYLNPERDMPDGAFRVHGLSAEFLSKHPLFANVADAFLEFIGDDPLVAHNADFDMSFLNMELARLKRPALASSRVVNTLLLARRKHPAGPNRLDDLCTRYKIDNTKRTLHGALLDAQLLAEVYAELVGGRQSAMTLNTASANLAQSRSKTGQVKTRSESLPPLLQENEATNHADFVQGLGEKAIWRAYS
ncbi:MAG: DNA polymerase III subunit epsilon [Pseudomonadota bacterium]